jgi:hypothetical protein
MQRPLRKGHGMPRAISTAPPRRTWKILEDEIARFKGTQCTGQHVFFKYQYSEYEEIGQDFSGDQTGQELEGFNMFHQFVQSEKWVLQSDMAQKLATNG